MHLGSRFPRGLSLRGHGSLQLNGQPDVLSAKEDKKRCLSFEMGHALVRLILHFHPFHLHAPGIGGVVE